MSMLQDHIICHYGEIALKGGNRKHFEAQLIKNLKAQLEIFAPSSFEFVSKNGGAIIIKLNKNGLGNIAEVKNAIEHTFGIVNFSIATSIPQDIEGIKKTAWDLIKDEQFESFRVTTQRSDKRFDLTSENINKIVGEYIFENFKRTKKVSLKNADLECRIFIVNDGALITLKKYPGLGGMPMGTASRAMTLMSGGFDSPIAAFQIMRRGVKMFYAHFHSVPYTSRESLEKVTTLVKVLNAFQGSGKIYLIPFADVQKEIVMKCPQSLRVILYRRLMLKIAEKLAKRERCLALVTGDSIGQVASQTMENILAVNEAATLPVFRPLIGMDKEEIMQKAKEIGTYDISKLPHDDCCSRLMPKSPETRAKLADVLEAEKALAIEKLISETLAKIEIVKL